MKSCKMVGLFCASVLVAAPAFAFDGWHLENATVIPGKTGSWDGLTVDADGNRLFIGHRKQGLQVFDLATNQVVKLIDKTAGASSNGAVLINEFDLGISTNENGTITPFKLSTLKTIGEPIKLGNEADSSVYDPATKRIFVVMDGDKTGAELAVVDAATLKPVGKVKLPSKKPQSLDVDEKGNLYVASRDMEAVHRVDTKTMQVTATWPAPGCGQTNGLAMDNANKRIFLGCRGSSKVKPSFAVMNAETGKVVYTSEIGGGNDSVIYDADLKRVFLGNGVGAVLNVFEQVNADTYKPVETLGTRQGMRSFAMHPKTKKIYAISAEGSADASKKITTSVSPFYANTFFDNTFSVFTFTKK